jgi:hypothetical protein
LWKGDGDLTDSVGGRTLATIAGTERYAMINPFVRGWHFDGATFHRYNTIDTALHLDEAYSFEAIIHHHGAPSATQVYATLASVGESLATNYMFQPKVNSSGVYIDFWEHSAGTDVNTVTVAGLPLRPFHLAVTRSVSSGGLQTLKVYVDGVLLATNTGITKPAKDPTPANNTQQFMIGCDPTPTPNAFFRGALGSVKLFNFELSEAQVLAESNYIRGLT